VEQAAPHGGLGGEDGALDGEAIAQPPRRAELVVPRLRVAEPREAVGRAVLDDVDVAAAIAAGLGVQNFASVLLDFSSIDICSENKSRALEQVEFCKSTDESIGHLCLWFHQHRKKVIHIVG
jgi:hypothetical protein